MGNSTGQFIMYIATLIAIVALSYSVQTPNHRPTNSSVRGGVAAERTSHYFVVHNGINGLEAERTVYTSLEAATTDATSLALRYPGNEYWVEESDGNKQNPYVDIDSVYTTQSPLN